MEKGSQFREKMMLFIKLPWQPKSKMPFFPYPREYWTSKGNEPYSWTREDVEYAEATGWFDIQLQQEDRYPCLVGVMTGCDPEHGYRWYLPKKPSSGKVLVRVYMNESLL
jgi:hypothetical protein